MVSCLVSSHTAQLPNASSLLLDPPVIPDTEWIILHFLLNFVSGNSIHYVVVAYIASSLTKQPITHRRLFIVVGQIVNCSLLLVAMILFHKCLNLYSAASSPSHYMAISQKKYCNNFHGQVLVFFCGTILTLLVASPTPTR